MRYWYKNVILRHYLTFCFNLTNSNYILLNFLPVETLRIYSTKYTPLRNCFHEETYKHKENESLYRRKGHDQQIGDKQIGNCMFVKTELEWPTTLFVTYEYKQ